MRLNKRKLGLKQRDIADCGPACLASVAAFYDLKIPVSRIREKACTNSEGTNLAGMIEAADHLGLEAIGVRGEFKSLTLIPKPAIAHLLVKEKLHHFVVVYRLTNQYVEVMDPVDGSFHKIHQNVFRKQWTGVLLLLTPSQSFQKEDRKTSSVSRFWYLIKPYKYIVLQAFLGSAFFTLIGLSTAIYIQFIVDVVIPGQNENLLNLLSLVMIVLLFVQTTIGILKTVFTVKMGQLIDARLILGYYKHLIKLPQHFFDSMRVGEIVSRINDAVKIRTFINNVSINLAVNLFIFLFSFGLMFTYYWKLGAVILTIIPCFGFIYFVTDNRNAKTQRRVMEGAAIVESQLVESITSISTIKQFGVENFFRVKIETQFINLLKSIYNTTITSVFSGSTSQFLSSLYTIILFWLGGYFVLDQSITTGELLSFYAIVGYFTGPVSGLIGMNTMIQDAMIAGDRLFEVMDLEKEGGQKLNRLNGELTGDINFENVSFRYQPGINIFEGLSLTIRNKQITAFVGESGSGKSSLINILQKLYPLSSGNISIGPYNLNYIDARSLRSAISVVPQDVQLFSGSIIENIALGEYDPDMKRMVEVCENLNMLNFIESLPDNFNTQIGENGAGLSGGQKQQIAIARALYRDPQIIIFDEATSSLDSTSEQHVLHTMKRLVERGKTIILIAHRLSTVSIADKIYVLDKGRVVEEGTHKELVDRGGAYYRLWQKQMPVSEG